MLKKNKRIKSRSQFEEVKNGSRIIWGKYFGFAYLSGKNNSMIGFIATKKCFKKAVDRNKFKRRMAEAIKDLQLLKNKPDCWMVFVAKNNFLEAGFEEIKNEIFNFTNTKNL